MRSPSVQQGERARFLSSMKRLWSDLGAEAGELLRGNDSINEDYYAEQFDQRVERDLALIAEEEFRLRYLRGYELSQVPRFRPDVRGWRDFVDSLVRQLCLDHTRTRSQSRLLQAVRNAVDLVGTREAFFEKPGELLELLRLIFEMGDAGNKVMIKATKVVTRYHRD